ncbi:hypothetical protein [Streptomyces sp. NPDC058247]|uniref:hypothetical protein n=1 Tax=Streptomyces sp. NPDC058247 TaxID=3346401 RepID=UPI0036E4560F
MTDLWDLTKETMEVRDLIVGLHRSDLAGTTTPEQERTFLLRRAALEQRHLAMTKATRSTGLQDAETKAEQTAVALWKHDQLHHSSRGSIPAADPGWSLASVHEYVVQEAKAAEGKGEQ